MELGEISCIILSPPNLRPCYSSARKIPAGTSLIAQLVKNLPAMQGILVGFLSREDLLEKGYAIQSSILGLPLWLSW